MALAQECDDDELSFTIVSIRSIKTECILASRSKINNFFSIISRVSNSNLVRIIMLMQNLTDKVHLFFLFINLKN
jgi:hypothetical protein